MDEQAIRQWAWDQAQSYRLSEGGLPVNTGYETRLRWADTIAAWVMSGTLPVSDA